MRSRTEMVTTTFVDSEEDYSDEDDSEEDWRPSASNKNGKKIKQQKNCGAGQNKKGRKRKYSSKGNKNVKRKATCDNSEEDKQSEDGYDCNDYSKSSSSKKQISDKNSYTSKNEDEAGELLNLLVYLKDLTGTDLHKNNQLCLWRKDKNNLLQKYIRIKTTPEQFIFTSSSVYSSFDDKRISDFCDIKVKTIDASNRRVKIINPSDLETILLKNSNENSSEDKNLSDEKSGIEDRYVRKKKHRAIPKYSDDDDDEEVEEENDEEEDDCNLEGEDDEDIEEEDESGNDDYVQ